MSLNFNTTMKRLICLDFIAEFFRQTFGSSISYDNAPQMSMPSLDMGMCSETLQNILASENWAVY